MQLNSLPIRLGFDPPLASRLIRAVLLAMALTAAGLPRLASAEVPNRVTFQGRLVDSAGVPIQGQLEVVARIFDAPDAERPLYEEVHLVEPSDGVLHIDLGAGQFLDGQPFDADLFAAADRWIEIEVSSEVLGPRQLFGAVPYAFVAQRVGTLQPNDLITQNNLAAAIDVVATTDPSLIQRRITQPCLAGQAIRTVNQDGSVACSDNLVTQSDLAAATDSTVVQRRIFRPCPPGQTMYWVDEFGDPACQAPPSAVTQVSTGTGLTGGPITDTGTVALDTGFTDGRYLRSDISDVFNGGFISFNGNIGINGSAVGSTSLAIHGAGNNYLMYLVKADGSPFGWLTEAEFRLDTRLKTKVVEITGGADIAEPFDMWEGAAVEPGMVVAIDPDNPGRLRLATRAYDRTVAGVVSGAGGVNPGLTLTQEGSVADGAHPVSLNGRVYVWADADANGPIKAGDLLTTSDVPGHAMPATDPARSHGAVLGKAMSRLENGRGLVLALVALQ